MVHRLEETLGTLFDKNVETQAVEEIFDFEIAYIKAYEMIKKEADNGNDIWINISSMPRTVAFAFASAANSLVIDNHDYRDQIHTYYVSAEKYLITEMIPEIRKEKEFLEDLIEKYDDEKIRSRLEAMTQLTEQVKENGSTQGASDIIEFPTVPRSDLNETEKSIITFLHQNGETESISELARKLAEENGTEYTDSMKSKIQYNVKNLEEKGFLTREKMKNRLETRLNKMGELWVETHPNQANILDA
jgi:hypothetical protein